MSFAPFDLSDKVALITGGNSGIGLGFAEGIAAAGADVCIWGTNPGKNEAALDTLRKINPTATAWVCDVGDEDAVATTFGNCLDVHGRIDGCFANAGVPSMGTPFHHMTEAEWRSVLRVNLDGVFYTFKHAAIHMKERAEAGDPGGRLVGTASLAAVSGQARGQHYAATKGGLVSMVKALAVEYARYGVTAHSVLPGWTETEMTEGTFANDKFVANVMKRIPARRWGQRDDFAGIAIYIMSDASGYHTAETFLIDGGYYVF